MGQTVAIILLAAVLAGGIYLYLRIRKSIRLFSMATFGTEHLIEGIQGHKDKLATTPKSVSGMTGICLPQIQRDFPEFSLEEAVQKAEAMAQEYAAEEYRAEALVSYLGIGDLTLMDVSPGAYPLDDGDLILLASDGLYRSLSEEEILAVVTKNERDMQQTADALTAAVKGRKKQDNTSVVILRYRSAAP